MDLVTIEEAAEMLHTPVATVRHWRATRPHGYPVGFRIGKRVMFDRADIVEFVQRRRAAERIPTAS